MRLANSSYDSFILSLPKSGRTWQRVMLGYYLARATGLDPRCAMQLDMLCAKAEIPSISYTHNWTSFSDKLPLTSKLVASPIEWQNKKVLLLVRDLRDVLVSAWFHCRYRERSFDGTISEYIRNPFVGMDKLLTGLNRWHNNRALARSFSVTYYEDMCHDPATSLRKVLAFAGVRDLDNSLVDETVEFTKFDNLQRLEASDFFNSVEMRNPSNCPEARKIRSGQIGQYIEHLSGDDLAYLEERERLMPNPFANQDRSSGA